MPSRDLGAGTLRFLRRYQEEAEYISRALALAPDLVVVLPDDWRVHTAQGLALAGLGRRQEALREARWLEYSRTYREDVYHGEADPALAEIERWWRGPPNSACTRCAWTRAGTRSATIRGFRRCS